MILFISDTHCYYDNINRQIEYAENQLGVSVSCVIHLGDFGIYRSQLHAFFTRQNKCFLKPVFFIEGNHEDFDALPWLVKKYARCFTHLPRTSVHALDGYRFLTLGGSGYMDAIITQKGAIITNQHINRCLEIPPDAVDIILTHDCPTGIGVPNTPGLEHYGPTGFPRSAELARHFKPKLWIFGHHHKWFEHADRYTRYVGLASSWKGFGLLDANFDFTVVKHSIPYPAEKPGLIMKLLVKCRIIQPN